MNDEVREFLRRIQGQKQFLSEFNLQVKFGDLPYARRGDNISQEARIKQIANWLKERGFRLRKVRNADYYAISYRG